LAEHVALGWKDKDSILNFVEETSWKMATLKITRQLILSASNLHSL